jgi:HAD superfamily hydrolase (TIGR01484 family)
MRPLGALGGAEASALIGVVFDLDDTLLDHGALGEAAYGALFRMREAGLRLVACTGRPAGWGDVLARQWPVDAVVAENGAVAFVVEGGGAAPTQGRKISLVDELAPAERRARRDALQGLAHELVARFPSMGLADDNDARRTDVTLDVGEHRRVEPAVVAEARAIARERGVRTLVSSIHLHLTRETDDKASGTIRLLATRFGEDATAARRRWAFVGDSANDAAAFAGFATTFGVDNVRRHLHALSVPPRYVAPLPMGSGFAAVAVRLAALRGAPSSSCGR